MLLSAEFFCIRNFRLGNIFSSVGLCLQYDVNEPHRDLATRLMQMSCLCSSFDNDVERKRFLMSDAETFLSSACDSTRSTLPELKGRSRFLSVLCFHLLTRSVSTYSQDRSGTAAFYHTYLTLNR